MPFRVKSGGGDATAKYSSNDIVSLSYAAHANGDVVYDIASGYHIEVTTTRPSPNRLSWSVSLYNTNNIRVGIYSGTSFPEADLDKWIFAGFYADASGNWKVYVLYAPSNSMTVSSGNSGNIEDYFNGSEGWAINADYAVIDVQSLSVTANGTYTAPFSKAYSPVTVDVQEQPWQPLQDGYSNFWFELTDDTLSPWLNFSAKDADAVIDWGDGSGEVALDTLTPTHTYSKAGKYVVKVKGVTGVSVLISDGTVSLNAYATVLKAVELNSEILTISAFAFAYCIKLEHVDISSMTGAIIGSSAFIFCTSMQSIALPVGLETISASAFRFLTNLKSLDLSNTSLISIGTAGVQYCNLISMIILPSTVETISQNALANNISLVEVHCQATVPPTLGNNVFNGLPANWVCYVPVGYGETYKAAAGWSAYADHILEEGQTVTRAMKAKFAKAAVDDTDTGDTEEKR